MSNEDKMQIIEGEIVEERGLQISNYMPALSVKQAVDRYNQMKQYVESLMKDGTDFGTIPGTPKATLLKPGAEKLTTLFGFTVKFIDENTVEKWEDDNPFFFYQRKCQLYRGDFLIAEASGSANSNESRYRWRWVSEDRIPKGLDKSELVNRGGMDGLWAFAYEKRETTGKYGKPEAYWKNLDEMLADGRAKAVSKKQSWNGEMGGFIEFPAFEYRVPNEDIFSLVNTVLKMAEKRALIAAVLIGCNASEFFTQDLEDLTGTDVQPAAKIEPAKATVAAPQAHQNANKPLETKKPTGNKVERPMAPEKLKQLLTRKANENILQNNISATAGLRGLMVGTLNSMFNGNDGDRRAFIRWLFDKGSSKDLDGAEVQAIMAWLDVKDGMPIGFAIDEANAAMRVILKAAGQADLPGIDGEK